MLQYDAFITLDFQKIPQSAINGIFQLIQLCNLETIYWVQWCSQEVEVSGKQCLIYSYCTPLLGGGLINMLEE